MEYTSYIEIECPCGKRYTIRTVGPNTGPSRFACECGRKLEVHWTHDQGETKCH